MWTMCLCGVCNKIALKWRVAILYVFPFVYCCMLLTVLGLIPAPFSTYPLLSASCVVFAVLNLLTAVVGLVGVFKGLDAALRGTVVLLVMENLMLLFVALFFLFSAVCRWLPAGLRPSKEAPAEPTSWWHMAPVTYSGEKLASRATGGKIEYRGPFWKQGVLPWNPETKWSFLLVGSAFLLASTTLTMCCLWAVAEFQAELDADAFVEDARNLREGERMMLLQTYKGHQQAVSGARMPQDPSPAEKDRGWLNLTA